MSTFSLFLLTVIPSSFSSEKALPAQDEYADMRSRASSIVSMLGKEVSAEDWIVERSQKYNFATLDAPGKHFSFSLADRDCTTFSDGEEISRRNRTRPLQGDKFETDEAWFNSSRTWLQKLWPQIPLQFYKVVRTPEKRTGNLWHSNSNLVTVTLLCPKPNDKVVPFSVTFDRGTGRILAFGRSAPVPSSRFGGSR